LLERTAVEFPHSEAATTALKTLAKFQNDAGHPEAAARAYVQLLRLPGRGPSTDAVAPVLADLARTYERLHRWDAAQDTWQILARYHGERPVTSMRPPLLYKDIVANRLKNKEYVALSRAKVPLSLPLGRIWQTFDGADHQRLLVPWRGSEPQRLDEGVFLVY